ncbi:MAG: hypothetical protein R3B82_20660 [Sandaracinaceae bacterium]
MLPVGRNGWVLVALVLSACSPTVADLVVSIRTDLVPGVEFDTVETALFAGESAFGIPRTYERGAARGDAFLDGQPVAEYHSIEAGDYLVRVRVLSAGRVILSRQARVDVHDALSVTLLLARDCIGVSCPAASDAPELTECLGGRCVDPACTDESPESCGSPGCSADADCDPGATCATASCVRGSCLVFPDDAACASGERCDPTSGCRAPDCVVAGDCGVVAACATVSCVAGTCLVIPDDSLCPVGTSCAPRDGCRPPPGSGCSVCGDDGTCTAECDGDCSCAAGCACAITCAGACNVTCQPGSECRVEAPLATVACSAATCWVDADEGTFSCGTGSTCSARCTDSTLQFDCINAECCWEGTGCMGRNCVGSGSCNGTTPDGTSIWRCNSTCTTPERSCFADAP